MRRSRKDILKKGTVVQVPRYGLTGIVTSGGSGYYRVCNPWSKQSVMARHYEVEVLPRCQLAAALILGDLR